MTGDMKGSIVPIVEGLEAFIGIPSNAPAHNGKAVSLAAIHEFGATILQVMTEKQRRYLFAVVFKGEAKSGGSGGGIKGFLFIKIPARPFIRPTYDQEAPKTAARFYKRLAGALTGFGSAT